VLVQLAEPLLLLMLLVMLLPMYCSGVQLAWLLLLVLLALLN
jgi:hypothetical protein